MSSSPHDALFRYTFGQPEHAVGLLRSVLPGCVVAGMDWSSLRVLPGTRVDEHLRRQQSDLTFSVRRREQETLVYVLIEHKRRGERWAVFQLLHYVMAQRFGPLSEQVHLQIAAASVEQVDRWALRLLDAGSLADVLVV